MAGRYFGGVSFRFSGNIPACSRYTGLARTFYGIAKQTGQKAFVWSRKIETSSDGLVEIRCQQTLGGSSIIYIHVPLVLSSTYIPYLLISQIFKPDNADDYQFYKIEDPEKEKHDEPITSLNNLQVSSNANSHTWSEYDEDGIIVRQLATLTTNLEPVDYVLAHTTEGLPVSLRVTYGGKYVAKLREAELSFHLPEEKIFRRTVSTAFFYEDDNGEERIGVITVCMQDPETGIYTGDCDVWRWSSAYDPDSTTTPELSVSEKSKVNAAGQVKQLITLNLDGTKAAFAASNKGYVLSGINSSSFGPSVSTAVDIPSENPAYSNPVSQGTGTRDYDVTYWIGKKAFRSYRWSDGLQKWITKCSNAGGINKDSWADVTNETYTYTNEETTDEDNPGSLIAFGYNIISDEFNVFVHRPAYLHRKDVYTNNDSHEQYETDNTVQADEWENHDTEVSDRKQTSDIWSDENEKIEFSSINEYSVSVNPTGNTVVDVEYIYERSYRRVLGESYGVEQFDNITEVYDVFSGSLHVIEGVDVATGVIHILKETSHTVDTIRTINPQYTFYDAKKGTSIILFEREYEAPYNPAQLPYSGGQVANYSETPETNLYEHTLPNTLLCYQAGWECANVIPPSCPPHPALVIVYKYGEPGNTQQIGGGYPEPFVATWDLI